MTCEGLLGAIVGSSGQFLVGSSAGVLERFPLY